MSNIKEMYHQRFVSPKDRDLLRFVWRKFSTDPIGDYRNSVHISGKIEDFCMDNFLDSFSGQAEAINICKEISKF